MSHQLYTRIKQLAKDDRKPKQPKSKFWTITNIWYFSSIGLIVLALIVASINHYIIDKSDNWTMVSLIILSLGYLGLMLMPLVGLTLNYQSIKRFFQNPLAVVIGNAERAHESDELFFKECIETPILELKLVRLEVEAERNAFLNRISSMIGKVGKLGLMPGLIALAVTYTKIGDLNYDWLQAFVYANAFLFFLAFLASNEAVKMERYVALIDLAIEELTEPKTGSVAP